MFKKRKIRKVLENLVLDFEDKDCPDDYENFIEPYGYDDNKKGIVYDLLDNYSIYKEVTEGLEKEYAHVECGLERDFAIFGLATYMFWGKPIGAITGAVIGAAVAGPVGAGIGVISGYVGGHIGGGLTGEILHKIKKTDKKKDLFNKINIEYKKVFDETVENLIK